MFTKKLFLVKKKHKKSVFLSGQTIKRGAIKKLCVFPKYSMGLSHLSDRTTKKLLVVYCVKIVLQGYSLMSTEAFSRAGSSEAAYFSKLSIYME